VKKIHPAVRAHMAAMGRKGGKAKSSAGGIAVWANMTRGERVQEMKRRAKVREANRKGKAEQAGDKS
jgi:hypothetical protein